MYKLNRILSYKFLRKRNIMKVDKDSRKKRSYSAQKSLRISDHGHQVVVEFDKIRASIWALQEKKMARISPKYGVVIMKR